MARPSDMPAPEAFADRPHGTRLRYISGCRCVPCRAANSRYETSRLRQRARGDTRGLVPADAAVRHVRALGERGMGYKRVADVAGVSRTVVQDILAGRQQQVRGHTARKLLAVTYAPADAALVDAKPTWQRIERLLREGCSKAWIARRLGYRTPALQLRRDYVLVRTARRVARLYRSIMAEAVE